MTPTPAIGAVLGLLFGFGLVLAITRMPVMRRPRLDERLAPYLVDRRDARRRVSVSDRTITPFPTLERVVRPHLNRWGDLLERFLGARSRYVSGWSRPVRISVFRSFESNKSSGEWSDSAPLCWCRSSC